MAVLGELVPKESKEPRIVEASKPPQPQVIYVEREDKDDRVIGLVLMVIGLLLMVLGFYKLLK